MEYEHVSKDQQVAILKGRLAGWEADHFGHEINLAALDASDAGETEKTSTRTALRTLEASITAGRAKLAELESE